MRRRDFVTLAGSAAAWPLAARAQQSPNPVIGFMTLLSREESADRIRAFQQGLSETGYVDGKNVTIEFRSVKEEYGQFPTIAADLVWRSVDVIVANTNGAALAAKSATSSIPIVFYIASDPVKLGLVDSLNKPGDNLTGVFIVTAQEAEQKRLELLHQTVPSANKMAALIKSGSPNLETLIRDIAAGAKTLGVEMQILGAQSEPDLDDAFAKLKTSQVGALLISADLAFFSWSKRLAELTTRNAMPAINQWREFVSAGGLMSYGSNFTDTFRQIGIYTGRILHGEKPGDLPIQQSTKVDLVVNLKTAKALGVTFPLTLLGRADEVIE
jgi:putative tryptophan/tyrosine transport system substrate-binding protein